MALIPLKDDNPLALIHFQYFTVVLIAICGGITWWAHIGGFGTVVVLVILFWHKLVPLLNSWHWSRKAPAKC